MALTKPEGSVLDSIRYENIKNVFMSQYNKNKAKIYCASYKARNKFENFCKFDATSKSYEFSYYGKKYIVAEEDILVGEKLPKDTIEIFIDSVLARRTIFLQEISMEEEEFLKMEPKQFTKDMIVAGTISGSQLQSNKLIMGGQNMSLSKRALLVVSTDTETGKRTVESETDLGWGTSVDRDEVILDNAEAIKSVKAAASEKSENKLDFNVIITSTVTV